MDNMLNKTLDFLKVIREFEKIERAVYRPDNRKENDVEHSYQVAIMAWFLSDQFELSLSAEKLLKYGLVHDLVEVYAGDTPIYGTGHVNTIETKKEREEKAVQRIKNEFGFFGDLIKTIETYEEKGDEESIFIYELDKLLPVFNMYLDDGYGWNKLKLNLEEIKIEKRSKVKNAVELVGLLEEMLKRLEDEEGRLFENKEGE